MICKYLPILLMLPLGILAQTQQFNTHIDTVKTDVLNIIGNRKVVIGTIIMPSTGKPKVLLNKASQYKDSTGDYITEFVFVTPENVPFVNVNIVMKFNMPFISANATFSGAAFSTGQGTNPEKDVFQFKAAQVIADSLVFTIRSKAKIFTTIYGIDGAVQP
jgi:hypothetical protein